MRKPNSFAGLMFFVIFGVGLTIDYVTFGGFFLNPKSLVILIVSFVLAFVVSYSIKVANQWEKSVVLRLGKFRSLQGPGLFFIIPIIDTIAYWIDTRVNTSIPMRSELSFLTNQSNF